MGVEGGRKFEFECEKANVSTFTEESIQKFWNLSFMSSFASGIFFQRTWKWRELPSSHILLDTVQHHHRVASATNQTMKCIVDVGYGEMIDDGGRSLFMLAWIIERWRLMTTGGGVCVSNCHQSNEWIGGILPIVIVGGVQMPMSTTECNLYYHSPWNGVQKFEVSSIHFVYAGSYRYRMLE